jgi:hypothetical protein
MTDAEETVEEMEMLSVDALFFALNSPRRTTGGLLDDAATMAGEVSAELVLSDRTLLPVSFAPRPSISASVSVKFCEDGEREKAFLNLCLMPLFSFASGADVPNAVSSESSPSSSSANTIEARGVDSVGVADLVLAAADRVLAAVPAREDDATCWLRGLGFLPVARVLIDDEGEWELAFTLSSGLREVRVRSTDELVEFWLSVRGRGTTKDGDGEGELDRGGSRSGGGLMDC